MGHPRMGPAGCGVGQRCHDHVEGLAKVLLIVCLAVLALIFSERPPPSFRLADMHALCVPFATGHRPAPAASPPAIEVTGPERDAAQVRLAHEDLQEMTLKHGRWVPERPAEQVPMAPEGQRPQDP